MSDIRFIEGLEPPTPPLGHTFIFVDEADGKFKQKDDTGAVLDLTANPAFPVDDTVSLVQDPVDNTKQMRIDAGAITTATTRVLSMPDRDLIVVDRLGLISGGDDPFVPADIIDAAVRNIRETDGPTTLLVGDVPDGKYLRRSGTALVGDDAIPTSFSAISDGETTTQSTVFVPKLKLTFTPSEASDWKITFCADVAQDTANRDVNYQFQEDDTTVLNGGTIQPDPNNGGGYISISSTVKRTLTAASHDFDIDFSSSNAAHTAKIRNARIIAEKVS